MTEFLQPITTAPVEGASIPPVFPQETIKRILFVTPRYHPTIGGVQNHVYQVSRRFARMGIDVTVLTTNPDNCLPAEEIVEEVRIRRVPAWPVNDDYYFAPQMYPYIRDGEWDIIHVQSYHTLVAPLAMWAALRSGIPYVTTFHGGGHSSQLRNHIRAVQQILLRPLFARAEKLIAISEFEIPLFSRRLRLPVDQFALIPNGGDLPQQAEGELTAVEEGLIVSIGRLEKYKGHQRVIAALPKILEKHPKAHLWIAGAGPYESDLWKLAHELGVADRVDIHAIPSSERDRMARELSKAALVVLFSEFETHPIAILEALSLGCSVLVADTSGLSEIAHKGLARAMSLKSTTSQLAEAIVEQLSRPQKPLAVHIPTWDECAARLLSVYRNVVSRRMPCTY